MILSVSDSSPTLRILRPEHSDDSYQDIGSGSDSGHEPSPLRITVDGEKTPLEEPSLNPREIPTISGDDGCRLRIGSDNPLKKKNSILIKKLSQYTDVERVKRDMKDEIKTAFNTFLNSTTAHGFPMVLSTTRKSIRVFWILLSIISLCCFVYQVRLVYDKYYKKDKIVNVELIFEAAPFPAITVCNLNPFKNHAARGIDEVRETLENYHQAVMYSKIAHSEEINDRKRRDIDGKVKSGGFRHIQYEPVLSDCDCRQGIEKDCVWKGDSVPSTLDEACICNFDNHDRTAWPCYNSKTWQDSICPECNDMGFCNIPNSTGSDHIPCMCSLNAGYCLLKPQALKHVWHFLGKQAPPPGNPFRKEYMEKLKSSGYENVTDQVAITTLTKEKLIMQMASLEEMHRASLSYGRHEFIKMCSFNGKQCNIETDFRLLIDPSFGNCFTFNADRRRNISSSRAGPNNGLRMMVFVNVSDYLPTTEASGVRIVIHGKAERPFPDTFGYSAPTGAVSSFGISLRQVNRIPIPDGDCIHETFTIAGSIYPTYSYTPEGCYRSEYQKAIQKICECADPRFPKQPGSRFPNCDTMDEEKRNCILKASQKWQRDTDKKEKRRRQHSCRHSCREEVFSTTYSAAKWPSSDINVDCDGRKTEECIKYYGENAAMLEIYYEQLSYEVLRESESYLFVNLISDVGGQAGLWLGASVLTCFEVIFFCIRIATACCRRCEAKGQPLMNSHSTDSLHKPRQKPYKRKHFSENLYDKN